MQYYKKDKKISIWNRGERVGTSSKYNWIRAVEGKVWAYYRQSGGDIKIVSSNGIKIQNTSEEAIFVINNRSDILIDSNTKILYNHKLYDITNIDDYEGYKTDIKLSVKYSSNYQSLETYYPGIVDD